MLVLFNLALARTLASLVKKKDGGWSFYVDYKAPNTINIPSKSLILIIKEFLDELHDARYFFKFDLKVDYHKI